MEAARCGQLRFARGAVTYIRYKVAALATTRHSFLGEDLAKLMVKIINLSLLVLLIAVSAYADVYMHNPRGSNDRNCERNDNRNNGNRLFDSQARFFCNKQANL